MNLIRFLSFIVILTYSTTGLPQGTAINETGAPPDASAILDIDHDNSGILIPRMSDSEIQNIHEPANGLWVFSSTQGKFFVFHSSDGLWHEIATTAFKCGGTFTDPRDGLKYHTELFGSICWMTENLNFGSFTNSKVNSNYKLDNSIFKKCYDNLQENCNNFGGLYSWRNITQFKSNNNGNDICPPGWSLPSEEDWGSLFTHNNKPEVDGDLNKQSKQARDSTNIEFNAEFAKRLNLSFAGMQDNFGNSFEKGNASYFWTLSRGSFDDAKQIKLIKNGKSFSLENLESNYFSVRCINKQ